MQALAICEHRYNTKPNYVIVDRFFPSSKTCSNCGQIKTELRLSDRTYLVIVV
ncbi:zinc ribbon domain-containing protein [Candidatus Albibeggiatoa sp. nov. BB20]|uniref:zinc ribbon domain-containing protein n=1 Tax=Candidatus Albibeggiatoa sp. nov. BB20 TaxID=3162723 RepID=UPI003365B11D